MLKLITIALVTLACTGGYYAFICYLVFEYGHEVKPVPSVLLNCINPKSNPGAVFASILIVIVMSLTLAGIILVYTHLPRIFRMVDTYLIFSGFFYFVSILTRVRIQSYAMKTVAFVGKIAVGLGALWLWKTYHNWIVMNVCMLVIAVLFFYNFQNITLRQCLVISAGIIMFDVYAVFGSGDMTKMVHLAGENERLGMFRIPYGLSPSAPTMTSLGFGDVLFPGLIILLAYRTHGRKGAAGAIAGYLFGMMIAYCAVVAFNFPQPATMYLIPAVFIGFWLTSKRGQKVVQL